MKAINKFFAKVGIVLLAVLSIIIDLIILAIGLSVLGVVVAVVAIVFIFYGTAVLTRKAIKGVR